MQQQTARRALAWLLYLLGGMMALAFFAVVMPTSTMASIADWLGVGPLHRSPPTEYLTRSLSALYGAYGVLHLYLARDVVRYLDLIVVIGWLARVRNIEQQIRSYHHAFVIEKSIDSHGYKRDGRESSGGIGPLRSLPPGFAWDSSQGVTTPR